MSTTSTRQAYRPSYAPAPGSVDLTTTSRCSCGQLVTLEELFSHDCPDDLRNVARDRVAVPTGPSDSLDVPEWRGGAGGHSPSRRSPSPKQLDYLASLMERAGYDPERVAHEVSIIRDSRQASAEIDRLKRQAAAAQPEAKREDSCRPNRYAGPCRFCGSDVAAGSGLLCRVDGRWAVEHKAGACGPAEAHTAANPVPSVDVPAGHYAIPSTGGNDLAFYRVDRPTEGDYAGRTFIKLVVGGHPDRNVKRDHVAGILARIAADDDAAARYGREVGHCYVCNRSLTDALSRQLGIGPECRKARP
jgi:hypothetical protein